MLLLKSVHFPQVLQSVQALVHPVRLQKLTIEPVNLLVSIHASLKLYIASDHTPLSFSLFERGPLCTTARQLVHALAMHYAAGALFRAGRWRTDGVAHLLSLSNASYSPAFTSFTPYSKWSLKPACVACTFFHITGKTDLQSGSHPCAFSLGKHGQKNNRMCAHVKNSTIYSH